MSTTTCTRCADPAVGTITVRPAARMVGPGELPMCRGHLLDELLAMPPRERGGFRRPSSLRVPPPAPSEVAS